MPGVLVLPARWGRLLPAGAFLVEGSDERNLENALSLLMELLTRPAIYAIGIAIYLHGLTQRGLASWVGEFYHRKLDLDAGRAAYLISVNSTGFFAGRSVLGAIAARYKIPKSLVLAARGAGFARMDLPIVSWRCL